MPTEKLSIVQAVGLLFGDVEKWSRKKLEKLAIGVEETSAKLDKNQQIIFEGREAFENDDWDDFSEKYGELEVAKTWARLSKIPKWKEFSDQFLRNTFVCRGERIFLTNLDSLSAAEAGCVSDLESKETFVLQYIQSLAGLIFPENARSIYFQKLQIKEGNVDETSKAFQKLQSGASVTISLKIPKECLGKLQEDCPGVNFS